MCSKQSLHQITKCFLVIIIPVTGFLALQSSGEHADLSLASYPGADVKQSGIQRKYSPLMCVWIWRWHITSFSAVTFINGVTWVGFEERQGRRNKGKLKDVHPLGRRNSRWSAERVMTQGRPYFASQLKDCTGFWNYCYMLSLADIAASQCGQFALLIFSILLQERQIWRVMVGRELAGPEFC